MANKTAKAQRPRRKENVSPLPAKAEVVVLAPPPTTDFVKFEKNLVSLGFFSPSSSRTAEAKPKTVTIVRMVEGRRVEGTVTITPGYIQTDGSQPRPAFAITADQDKYLAFHKILMERRRQGGEITNPVQFSSAELLRMLGVNASSGKNLKEVGEWLDVMATSTVISKGVVYLAGRKRWATDRFHVFDRAISVGETDDDGRVAEKNLVWLSAWQLENINSNFTLPIDFETYRQLRNHIAKALVPLLQVWLYATRDKGFFEKRYDELCQILSLSVFAARSRIVQQLGRSLDELEAFGYLARWDIQKTTDGKGWKVVLWHGEKFFRDRLLREGAAEAPDEASDESEADGELDGADPVGRLVALGVSRREAPKVIARCKQAPEIVEEQIEYLEWYIPERQRGADPIRNPGAFARAFVLEDQPVPVSFETHRKRSARDERKEQNLRERDAEEQRLRMYQEYANREIDRHLATQYPGERYERLLQEEREAALKRHPDLANRIERWSEATLRSWLEGGVRQRLRHDLPLMSPEEFFASTDRTSA